MSLWRVGGWGWGRLLWFHGDVCCGSVGPDQTRVTSLGKGSYLWLYFKSHPSTGRSTRSHLGGPNNPAVVYRAFPHDQPAVNCVALGHFGELGMCWLLFSSAFFLTGGFEATKINKSLHSQLNTAFPRPSPVRCLSINRRDVQLRGRQTRLR